MYGIQLPGVDGSCGMVSVVPQANFDIGGLYSFLKEKLPSYAIPIFVRIQAGMTVTGTFKHQKVDLKKQGCDPSNDKVFWLKNGGYVLFSRPEFLNLMAGKL